MRIAFDRFVLDVEQRRLFRDDTEVRLGPKAFELLRLLVEQRPRALSKEEILAAVWPGTFITENSLATHIADLRAVLGDDAQRPRFIRTVYGYGYAFAGAAGPDITPIDIPALPVTWLLLLENHEIALSTGDHVLGRSGPGILALDSPTVSRRHARITVDGEHATIEDLGSKNGTWVGDYFVSGPVRLNDGDQLRLGSVVLVVKRLRTGDSIDTAVMPAARHDDSG